MTTSSSTRPPVIDRATAPKESSAAQKYMTSTAPAVRVADGQQPVVQVHLVRRERRLARGGCAG